MLIHVPSNVDKSVSAIKNRKKVKKMPTRLRRVNGMVVKNGCIIIMMMMVIFLYEKSRLPAVFFKFKTDNPEIRYSFIFWNYQNTLKSSQKKLNWLSFAKSKNKTVTLNG